MSQNPYPDQQEIDLRSIGRGLSHAVDRTNSSFFRMLAFLRRNIIIVGVLFIAGAVLGYLMERGRMYQSQLIVQPHFNSVDHVYHRIELLQSKIKVGDTAFLNSIGVKKAKSLRKISISPISDVYQFVNNNSKNFELLKLMVEDGDVKRIIQDRTTSKNYPRHQITINSGKPITEADIVEPLIAYLNNSEYYAKVRHEYVNNLMVKLEKNEETLEQINGLLDKFASKSSTSASSTPNLVYYNENTQLSDVLRTKDELLREQGEMRLDLISLDKIVKLSSSTLNVREDSGLMMFILPVVFVLLFIILTGMRKTYRLQKAKFQQG